MLVNGEILSPKAQADVDFSSIGEDGNFWLVPEPNQSSGFLHSESVLNDATACSPKP